MASWDDGKLTAKLIWRGTEQGLTNFDSMMQGSFPCRYSLNALKLQLNIKLDDMYKALIGDPKQKEI